MRSITIAILATLIFGCNQSPDEAKVQALYSSDEAKVQALYQQCLQRELEKAVDAEQQKFHELKHRTMRETGAATSSGEVADQTKSANGEVNQSAPMMNKDQQIKLEVERFMEEQIRRAKQYDDLDVSHLEPAANEMIAAKAGESARRACAIIVESCRADQPNRAKCDDLIETLHSPNQTPDRSNHLEP